MEHALTVNNSGLIHVLQLASKTGMALAGALLNAGCALNLTPPSVQTSETFQSPLVFCQVQQK